MPFIGNTPDVNFTSFAKQDLTGVTGSPAKRGFTLTHAVANANEIEVFVNNVRQEPTDAYTVSGTGLTMTGDVETTDDFYIIYLGKAIQTTVPPDGSVSTAKIADDAVTSAKLDTNIAISGTLDVSGAFTSQGIDDNADATAITIDSSEKVGINETSPDKKVHITEGNGDVLRLERSGSFSGTWDIKIGSQATGDFSVVDAVGSTTPFHIEKGSPTSSLKIASNGLLKSTPTYNNNTGSSANMVVFSDGQFARSTSSLRYKNTINDATHGLTELLTLRPVTYKGNNEGDTVYGGLIAEEVHDAGLTEFVTYNDDGEPDALAYSNMVSLCIKAIQELKTELDEAKARITALENS